VRWRRRARRYDPPRPRHRLPVAREVGHPINPKIIGTAQDAQLNAALDLLKVPRAAAR
jgi:hypothetical protein